MALQKINWLQIDTENIPSGYTVTLGSPEQPFEHVYTNDLGLGGRWIQTSYNNNVRNVYAGIGFTYDETRYIFISPKPYPSWILNSEGYWESPIPRPTNPYKVYGWDEESQIWIESDPINL